MNNGTEDYWFYLYIEYMALWHKWIKLYEDYWDLFWVKKIEED